MYTLFGVLLGVCSVLYSVRIVAWLYIAFNKKIKKEVFADGKTSKSSFYWGGLEHLFYIIVLIVSTILLIMH